MSDMFVGSQAPIYQNVCITRRSKSGKILEQRFAKNRVTRLMLYGIGKFLLGHFNDSTPDKIYEFIPRYLALGTNQPGSDYQTANVSKISSVNDTRLLNEITQSSTIGTSESVKRIWIAERNMCKINTKFSDPSIKISIKTYISSNHYDGMEIGEAGLFSKEKDNNCLARVCFPTIKKNHGEVLDIQWDITLLSYGETKYPDKLEIENGSKITLPLKYTNRHYKTFDLGLKRYNYNGIPTIGNDTKVDLFTIDSDNNVTTIYEDDDIIINSGWKDYLISIGLAEHIDLFLSELKKSKIPNSFDLMNTYYFLSEHQDMPVMFHFNNLYSNENSDMLDNDSLCVTLLLSDDKSLNYTELNASYLALDTSGSYQIEVDNDKQLYKVLNNQFYKKESNSSTWVETGYYMYNGVIVDSKGNDAGYSYHDGHFYSVKTTIINNFTYQYLNYSNSNVRSNSNRLVNYKIDSYGTIQKTGYELDYEDDFKIYLNDEYSEYHLSNDNYWVDGNYLKLIPILTPKDCTDRTITWKIQNANIAKINFNGVITAWNLGETTAIASTSNDLRAKCIIEVVKESSYIDIDNITLDPTEVTLIVDGDKNQYVDVIATITPLFASNATVEWKLSTEIKDAVKTANLGNNTIRLSLSSSGNIGTGQLTAISQSGKSASCLVKVLYNSNNDNCDCPDESHLLQKG